MDPTLWKPVLDGNLLPPCPIYDALVMKGLFPNAEVDPEWSKAQIFPSLKKLVPERADEIWESILALWRLREEEENEERDETWSLHLSAWLVSYQWFANESLLSAHPGV